MGTYIEKLNYFQLSVSGRGEREREHKSTQVFNHSPHKHKMSTHTKANDLFLTTLEQLHGPAPKDMLVTLRSQLRLIQQTNPNSAQTAEACLGGLVSDRSTLLHVLTAAYLINGGVMLKHQVSNEEETAETLDFHALEEELRSFSIDGELKLSAKTPLKEASIASYPSPLDSTDSQPPQSHPQAY
jgi:hypothetical protein